MKFERIKDICDDASNSIISGKIIAWFQGRLEFGDRALGNRSILADPRNPSIKDKINKFINIGKILDHLHLRFLKKKQKNTLRMFKQVILWKIL